jgi:hypothetical protein
MLLVAGRHVVGDEGNVDIGLSDEQGVHSFSVVAEGWDPAGAPTLAPVLRIIRKNYWQRRGRYRLR